MLWYGAGHFGGWNGAGGVTIGRITDTRSGTSYYNCINSSWDSNGSSLVINPLGGNVGIGATSPKMFITLKTKYITGYINNFNKIK